MVMSAEAIVEQRRLRRSLMLWRLVAIAIVAAIVIGFGIYQSGSMNRDHVARVEIYGFIVGTREELRLLDSIAGDDSVKAVLLDVNSPGGSTTGGEALLEAIDRIREKKPVVVTMGTVATSAGYMVSLGADRIIARGSTITGSIGVLMQTASGEKLLDTVGLRFDTVRSGPLKAQPGFEKPMDDKTRAVMQGMIDESYEWFLGLVTERRPLDAFEARRLSDGRVYTGRQALAENLIDEIGGEREARQWMADERDISKDLPLITRSVGGDDLLGNLRTGLAGALAPANPASQLVDRIEALINERVFLDGLVSVWQAADFGSAEQ